MRMAATDIADITGATYTYLLNGHGPADGWTGLYTPGERVRLRVINASAMTYFNFRIPGLPLTVVQADGQDVEPVEMDEVQLAVAETLDLVVEPGEEAAYAIVAESMDRSGMAVGHLTPAAGRRAEVPALRTPPRRTMADMGHGGAGMDHGGMDHSQHAGMDHGGMDHSQHAGMNHGGMDHSQHAGMNHGGMDHSQHAGMDHGGMDHSQHAGMDKAAPGNGAAFLDADRTPVSPSPWQPERGPGVTNVVASPTSRVAEPGTGLAGLDHRVLTYADLRAREPFYDRSEPTREIWLHLTGNMERYMWSFDGQYGSGKNEPVRLAYNERVRLVFINHTMMEHPIHLHGMWMEVENGQSPMPRKHTISVKPAERLSVLVTADAPGDWAFHCHLLLHMKAGMMRKVTVAAPAEEVARARG
jgi:FtsP/CotA-like multicopper oxidase with cupredoxin domain